MAASKGYFARANYRFFSSDHHHHHHSPPPPESSLLELDESDIWSSPPPEIRKPKISKKYSSPIRIDRAAFRSCSGGGAGAEKFSSLPVNIPDWSKILKEEYRENQRRDSDDDDDEEFDRGGGDDRIPPHEFLARQMARTRIASFSVHEGVGRTLKGRDLSRVRNAIWEKTGFQD